jgi:hypothetical protein
LEPDGVLELLDICHPFRAEDDTTETSCSPFLRFGYQAEKCWARSGLDFRASTKHVERLNNLGFVNVMEEEKKWPLGEWTGNARERSIGRMTLQNFLKFLDLAGVPILTSNSSMNDLDARVLVAAAQKDLVENNADRRYYLTV